MVIGMHQCQLTGYKLHVLAVKPINSCSMNTKHHSMLDPVRLGTQLTGNEVYVLAVKPVDRYSMKEN